VSEIPSEKMDIYVKGVNSHSEILKIEYKFGI
jgi:hypothetical protein